MSKIPTFLQLPIYRTGEVARNAVRVKSEYFVCIFSRFWAVFENDYKAEGSYDLLVTPLITI